MSSLNSLNTTETLAGASVIDGTSFGARYNTFREFDAFTEQVDDTSLGLLVWPGGTLAEVNDGRYGFQHEGLFDSARFPDRANLEDIFEIANENGMAVSVVLPTAIYQDNPEALKAGAEKFFEDLYSGKFGPLPDKLIFEIGNEFYDVFDGSGAAQAIDYAEVVNTYAEVISEVEATYNPDPDQVQFSVQIGKDADSGEAMLDALTDEAIMMADLVSHHRFSFGANGAGRNVDEVEQIFDAWGEELDDLGGDKPGLFLSAYNTASLTRKEAAQLFKKETGENVDHTSRSNREFEEFYQDQLAGRAHGLEQGENLLQIFSEYQPLGVEAAGVYGWDTIHAARSSLEGEDGNQYIFAAGATQDMMAESLIGTQALDWFQDNDHTDKSATSVFGFDSSDKLVIFLAAPEFSGGTMTTSLSLSGLGDVQEVWGESLTAETPEDWHEIFGIPKVQGLDQSEEAETFAVGIRESFAPEQDGDNLEITFTQPGEIVRLTFARNEAGRSEIEQWHGGQSTQLSEIAAVEDFPTSDPTESDIYDLEREEEAEAEEQAALAAADDGGGGGAGALLLALILPLLLMGGF